MLNKLDMSLDFHQKALGVRAQRQELIAANIANADTPNYKARDIDFKTTMQSALAGIKHDAFKATKTDAMHMDGAPTANNNANSSLGEPLFRPITQGSIDGNTVDMDVERNQFADNAIRYEASLTMLNGQLKKILAALQSS